MDLSSGIRGRCGQNRPFLPRYAGDAPRNKPFTEPHTRNRMEKNAFRTPPRGLRGGFSFRRCPSVGALPLLAPPPLTSKKFLPVASLHAWRPFRTRQRRRPSYWRPSAGGVACPGDLFAPVNGAWRSKKSPCLRIGRRFLAISARLYALRAPSAAFFSREANVSRETSRKMERAVFHA